MKETAHAKINLALHVRERQADGYHRIETIFAFAEDGDTLSVADSDQLSLEVRGPFAAALGSDNLVIKAAEALRRRFGSRAGAALVLEKKLPVAAGIGGGSADAAAALRLLNRWWKIEAEDRELLEIGANLGADVPACVASRLSRGSGKGDMLVPAEPGRLAGMPLLLVNPYVPLPTGSVFARWDGVDRGGLASGDPLAAALMGRNDLEPAAVEMAPAVAELLDELQRLAGVLLSRMSGSGATCFALFDSVAARDDAKRDLAAARPEWWQLASRIR